MEGGPPHPVGEGGTPLTHRVGRMDPPHPVGELSDVDCTCLRRDILTLDAF